jgi:glycerol-1-phosphate dehydrogenase [NAD(P)+]
MIYKQTVALPIIFQLDENNIDKIGYYLNKHSLTFKKVAVLSGANFSFAIAKRLSEENNWQHIVIEEEASFRLIDKLSRVVMDAAFDLLVAVGGGNVIDVCKRISFIAGINFIAAPTIISNDGLISPISVIRNEEGFRESLPAQMPMGIVVDLKIIADSPKQYLKASAGDILTNLSATNDWELACDRNDDKLNDTAYHIARNAALSLIFFSKIDFSYRQFIQQIVLSQIYSGLAMALAGESRPCSGSEHLISHAIDYLKLTKGVFHGTQVGSISLFSLFIQKKLLKEHLVYASKVEIPFLFHTLGSTIFSSLATIFNLAKKMRPGRFTVLNEMTEKEFVEQYDEYCRFIERRVNLVEHELQLDTSLI